ncbi:MAG TPA: peptidylprolyl isomerase [Vicinamibacterales bacterium]|nr:peptidylprolyl isomerase [Vicinamibacterales bacterium]
MNRSIAYLLLAGTLVAVPACKKSTANAAQAPAGTSGQQSASQPAEPAAAPAPKPLPAQLPDVLARVNGEAVTKTDFERLIKNLELGNGPIPADRRDEILRGALDQLITMTALTQEAKSRQVSATDAEVDARVAEMRKRFPDESAFTKALADRNMTLERLKDDTRTDTMIGKMLDAEVASAAAVTDEQVREFYQQNPDKFTQGESIRASHILIKAAESADAATKQKARAQIDEILKQAKAGADFAKLAQQHSQDGSAAQGGDLGFFGRGQMVPPFEQAAFALAPGQISEVVTTQFGYHIIKLAEKREASTVPIEQVSDRIRQFLEQQKKQERARAFIDSVKSKARIEVLV